MIAFLAYAPSLNNGFIADDYVILKRVEILKTQPLYLLQVPPENFRSVSYIIFGVLKALAGFRAWVFYAFNIGLHATNVVLLYLFVRTLTKDEETARFAALFFGAFQAPQEAVMWLAAMNETTLFFFTVLTLYFWSRSRYRASAVTYLFALFSKEAAIIVPLWVVLLDVYQGRGLQWRRYLLLGIPTAVFVATFLFTVSHNFMLTTHSYSLGFHAIVVLAKTLHRLLWPWLYIVLIAVWFKTRKWQPLLQVGFCLAGVLATMMPYMFITYQTSLPSRQLYLASAVLMTLFAAAIKPIRGTALGNLTIVVFLGFNIGYLWLRKDAQFLERAAPTTQLLKVLREHPPQRTVIHNFAYPFPEIASSAVLALPDWDPSLVSVGDAASRCTECLVLEWASHASRYNVTEIP